MSARWLMGGLEVRGPGGRHVRAPATRLRSGGTAALRLNVRAPVR
ncbi:MAG: hypothetical protein SF097_24420 [Acidobacteriota bacterium]|nr:hypothetical protein [Acidobacteriota bacterium]